MKRLDLAFAAIALLVLASCGGGGAPAGSAAFSALSFDLVTNPGSTVTASQVTGQYINTSHTDFNWISAALPAGSAALAGMQFSPETAPGAGFSGLLSTKLDTAKGSSAVVASQLVNVYRGNTAQRSLTLYTAVQTGPDGSFSLPLNFLGLLVFASSDGQPSGGFTIAAFADQSAVATGQTINFRATAQNAVGAVSFAWDFGDGNSANGANVQHSYNAAGSYNVGLLATDSAGNSAPAVSTEIVVTGGGTPPPLTGVSVTVTPTGGAGSRSFSYQATRNGGTGPFTHTWTFDLTQPGSVVEAGDQTAHTFPLPGIYNGRLTVADATGAIVSADFVSDASAPLLTGVAVTVTPTGVAGSFSYQAVPNGGLEPFSYAWTFDLTQPGSVVETGDQTTHTFPLPGVYNGRVTVTDATGASVSADFVSDASPPPLTGVTVTVTPTGVAGSGSFSYQATPTGGTDPFSYVWVFDLTPPLSSVTAGEQTAHTFPLPGIYNGRVTVTDATGASASADFVSDARQNAPEINALLPDEAERGETVEIKGTDFGAQQGNGRVLLGGTECAVDTAAGGWNDTAIFVIVPPTAVNSNFVVETEIGASNAVAFRVLPPPPGPPGGGQF